MSGFGDRCAVAPEVDRAMMATEPGTWAKGLVQAAAGYDQVAEC